MFLRQLERHLSRASEALVEAEGIIIRRLQAEAKTRGNIPRKLQDGGWAAEIRGHMQLVQAAAATCLNPCTMDCQDITSRHLVVCHLLPQ